MSSDRRAMLLFVVCLCLFLWHQYMERVLQVSNSFTDSYLDPFLCMPIVLHLIVWERRLFLKNRHYTLPLNHIIGYVLLISIFCEILFPLWNSSLVADVYDVLLYALGGAVYYFMATPFRLR